MFSLVEPALTPTVRSSRQMVGRNGAVGDGQGAGYLIYERNGPDLVTKFTQSPTSWSCSPPSREIRAGTDAEAKEEYCLLSCLPWLAHLPSAHLPRGGTIHNGLGPPTSIIN